MHTTTIQVLSALSVNKKKTSPQQKKRFLELVLLGFIEQYEIEALKKSSSFRFCALCMPSNSTAILPTCNCSSSGLMGFVSIATNQGMLNEY